MKPEAAGFVEVEIPIRIESEMNRRDHWGVRRKRRQAHEEATYYTLLGFGRVLQGIAQQPRLAVTLTRLAPTRLDSDNLASGFKFCRDAIANLLGIDDGDDRIDWRYRQERAHGYSARVRIEAES